MTPRRRAAGIAIGCIMVRLSFATSMKFIQLQHFFLSLVSGLDVTQNISTAERALTVSGHTKKTPPN
jgi:hypothetical protein